MPTRRRTFLAALGLAAGARFVTEPITAQVPVKSHVVLLGDSIFDNKPYVGEGPCVIEQVERTLGGAGKATLLAVDGSVTEDVLDQIRRLPESTTHLVISSGGNDALGRQDVLTSRVDVAAQAFHQLYQVQSEFGKQYRRMLDAALAKVPKVAVCTIYDPSFPEILRQQVSIAALAAFNDQITRAAFSRGVPVIDLRLLFTSRGDYANPIEPSSQGGQKIADVIARIVDQHDFGLKQSRIYAGG